MLNKKKNCAFPLNVVRKHFKNMESIRAADKEKFISVLKSTLIYEQSEYVDYLKLKKYFTT